MQKSISRLCAGFLSFVLVTASAWAVPDENAILRAKESMHAGFQSQVEAATREIESGQYEGKRLAGWLRDRGVQQSHLLKYDLAIADFTQAIELDGFNPQFYQDRAIAYMRARQLDKANTDLDMVLGLERNNFSALREKGRIAFYRGEFTTAADMFVQASRNADQEGMVYSMLWASMSAQRAGKASPLALSAPSEAAKAQWPVPVAELFTGALTPDKVLSHPVSDNARNWLMQQCEAHFYVGQYYLFKGDKAAARAEFQAAVDTQVTDFMEYDWALHELETLK